MDFHIDLKGSRSGAAGAAKGHSGTATIAVMRIKAPDPALALLRSA